MNEISSIIREKAPIILAEIQKAKSVLLHCHPLPDPDSTGSALAMKCVIEQMGKIAEVIKGDSEIPHGFMHFPKANNILMKSFAEVDLNQFDLFISLDSGSRNMVSQEKPPAFPLPIKTIVIDHHATNDHYGEINLVDASSPATAFIIFQLLKLWNITITYDIALNLFMGIYTDTGGFKYALTDHRVIAAAAELAKVAPDFTEAIFGMENDQVKEALFYQALALNSIETFFGDSLAISSVSNSDLVKRNIPEKCIMGVGVANILISVSGWNIGVSMVERRPEVVKISCRTRDSKIYDVSKLAEALGGGGHRAAAAAVLYTSLSDAKKMVVEKAKELYNL